MARLNQAENDILPLSALSHPICFVVDMVNGFVKEGALHDAAILDLCAPISALIEKLQCRTVFVADTPADDQRVHRLSAALRHRQRGG